MIFEIVTITSVGVSLGFLSAIVSRWTEHPLPMICIAMIAVLIGWMAPSPLNFASMGGSARPIEVTP